MYAIFFLRLAVLSLSSFNMSSLLLNSLDSAYFKILFMGSMPLTMGILKKTTLSSFWQFDYDVSKHGV